MSQRFFERFPKTTLAFIWVFLGGIGLALCEQGARHFGLGDVVVYHANPIYGYRPVASQELYRFDSAQVKINNLGLRAQEDWLTPEGKVLFLGDSVTYGGSYIDNQELFSHIATQGTPLSAGNAGVNGWGVLNIHALVKDNQFTPAQLYVTVIPEGDFYRGLTRLGGQPYWTKKAQTALEELFFYGLYKLYLRKSPGLNFAQMSEQELDRLVDIAARHLKEMDSYLKAQGFDHTIVISPTRSQALQVEPKDNRVHQALINNGLHAHYFADKFEGFTENVDELYQDSIHLTAKGHKQWGSWLNQLLSY